MTTNPFLKATKEKARGRLALVGTAGSGKTFTALTVAHAWGGKIALLDSEHGKASKYAHQFDFDTLIIDNYSPATYTELINAAGEAGYDTLIVDSLSHAWAGKGGALQIVDLAKQKYGDNNYFAWRDVTPLQDAMIESIIASPCHVIATMRAKAEYVIENVNGKQKPKKIGMSAIQRDGVEYEFDVTGRLDSEHTLFIERTSIPALDGAVIKRPGAEFATTVMDWLQEGAEPIEGYARLQADTTQAERDDGNFGNLGPIDPAHESFGQGVSEDGTSTDLPLDPQEARFEGPRPEMPPGKELPLNPKTGKPYTQAQLTLAHKRGQL